MRIWTDRHTLIIIVAELLGLCNFIAKSVMHIIVVACAVIVLIATRCPVSHCRVSEKCRLFQLGRVTKQCRALDNHHYYVWCHGLRFMPYELNLQVFVNCLYKLGRVVIARPFFFYNIFRESNLFSSFPVWHFIHSHNFLHVSHLFCCKLATRLVMCCDVAMGLQQVWTS